MKSAEVEKFSDFAQEKVEQWKLQEGKLISEELDRMITKANKKELVKAGQKAVKKIMEGKGEGA